MWGFHNFFKMIKRGRTIIRYSRVEPDFHSVSFSEQAEIVLFTRENVALMLKRK